MAILPISDGWEFYGEPDLQGPVNDDDASLDDFSGNNRHLDNNKIHPIFKTNIINGHSIIRFDGLADPLENLTNITVRSGFIVAKYNGATFSDYKGLLSGRVTQDILTGNGSGVVFFNFSHPSFEFRSNHRIYAQNAAPAPMNAFHIIFFKFWLGTTLDGFQIGQQRTFTDRKWNGDIAFLALTKRNLHEEEIHDYTLKLATYFNITLPSVYPYQADYNGHGEEPEQDINFYDPPEGARITEVVSPSKDSFELKFSGADSAEIDYFKDFYKTHYEAGLPFIYRDYRFGLPRDFEGYFDSPPQITGQRGEFAYAFKMRQI